MSEKLNQEVRYIKGIGVAKAKDFARLEIVTLKDVLFDFPFRHDDLSESATISQLKSGQKVTIRATVSLITNRKSKNNRRMIITEAILEDGTGQVKAMWFHQGFLTKVLRPGVVISLSGKVDDKYGLSFVNPTYEVIGKQKTTKHTGRILPVYALAGGITQKMRRMLAETAIDAMNDLPEWLPEEIIKREGFVSLQDAIRSMHFPSSKKDLERATTRLKFDEFFLHQILHAKARRELLQQKASKVKFQEDIIKDAVKRLPFALTAAQKKATWAIIKDMDRVQPMNRLLEGDVGTGKTIVAALAALNASHGGWQTAFLAPTEILAEQHATNLEKLFGHEMRVALFTRTKRRVSGNEVTKKQMLDALANGKIDLAIGTHALLSEHVLFNRLGLIVVDEQHRFGVKQRKALKDREGDGDGIPHLLSMTATPIPRSLALVMYGDLDRSLLDEYPAGRKKIETFIVEKLKEEPYYEKMREEMDAGRQVFVVCPIIEESDALGVNSVNEVFRDFEDGPFRAYNIGMLHGKLKQQEKDEVMQRFVRGELDMLVSTTVVEVGVDVRNATVMFIEGAERFGLAQLHQLRGRVGRGDHQSYCFLHPTGDLGELARKRLKAVVATQNGFVLADKDLELRGPGNIFGTEQSGFETFKLGSFADRDLIFLAKDYARDYLDEDEDLQTWPMLRERVFEYVEEVHFE